MKITAFILLIACLKVQANSYGQEITLSKKQAPLSEIFAEIRKQTDYLFLFYEDDVALANKVTIHVKGASIGVVLKVCFENQPLAYTIKEKTIIISKKAMTEKTALPGDVLSPPIDVKGQIVNEDGNPMAASIVIKGSNRGTNTNENGEFILSDVPEDATLVISGVGIETKELKLQGTSSLYVTVKISVAPLDETIIRGYYSISKRVNTGNVTKVKGTEIQKQVNADPIVALQGRVPGLFISQSNGYSGGTIDQIRLRGQNSIANGNNPLFVVDGIPFTSTSLTSTNYGGGASFLSPFTLISPSDIESIEVLKDADATAIYGSRGANGVILITTRKGKMGKPTVSVDFNTGFAQVGHKLDLLNTEQYLEMRREAFFTNDGLTTTSPQYTTAYDINGKWDTTRYTDWQKILIGGTGHVTNAQISLSGGNANTQFLIGSAYRKETTVLPGSFRDERISFHVNVSSKALDNKLMTTFSAMYSNDNNLLPNSDLTSSIVLAPDAPAIYDSAGNINWQENTWDNPFATLLQTSKSITSNLNTSLNIGYKIIPNLELSTRLGFNTIQMDQSIIMPMSSFSPSFASPTQRTNNLANNKIKTLIAEPQLTYSLGFSKANMNFIVGSSFQQTTQQTTAITALNFASDQLINNPSAATTVVIDRYSNSVYRLNSFFGRANFDWDEKYLINVTGRRDGSSRFGPGKQFGNFGAIGAGWVFSKESFFKNISFLGSGKLRASYGSTGNEPGQDYQYLSLYAPSTGTPYQDVVGLNPTNLSDPNFRWEIVKKLELGIDMEFFQKRLFLSASYYRNRTGNQIVGYPLSTVTGFSSITTNLPAVIKNTGVELEINSAIVKGRDFRWNASINLTIPKNKLVSFPDLANSPSYKNRYEVGKSLFVYRGYHYMGVNPQTGVYIFEDVNGDNKISNPQDFQGIKEITQKFFGGFQNSLTYKGFQLDVLLQFVNQTGYNWANSFIRAGQFITTAGNQPTKVLERWRKPGDITDVQKFSSSNSAVITAFSRMRRSDYQIAEASFVRLKNASLSYQFSPTFISKAHVQALKIYLRGDNLFTISKYLGLDPETNNNGLALPPLRMITGGIQITF